MITVQLRREHQIKRVKIISNPHGLHTGNHHCEEGTNVERGILMAHPPAIVEQHCQNRSQHKTEYQRKPQPEIPNQPISQISNVRTSFHTLEQRTIKRI